MWRFGASPRGSINLVHAARAMALLRGRRYALPQDMQELTKDVLRHRLVLTYQALAENVTADDDPGRQCRGDAAAAYRLGAGSVGVMRRIATALHIGPDPGQPGPGADAGGHAARARPWNRAAGGGVAAGRLPLVGAGLGDGARPVRLYEPGDDVRRIDWNVTARTGEPHIRVQVAERVLTTWLVLDTSASMTFGTAERRKADVAEGVALAVGHVATRAGTTSGWSRSGRARTAYGAAGAGPGGDALVA